MCFLVEKCKYCRPQTKSQDDRSTLPKEEESPAVNSLRECLETMERDRLEAEARRTKCPTLMGRYYLACEVWLSEFIASVLLVFINQQVLEESKEWFSLSVYSRRLLCECFNSRT